MENEKKTISPRSTAASRLSERSSLSSLTLSLLPSRRSDLHEIKKDKEFLSQENHEVKVKHAIWKRMSQEKLKEIARMKNECRVYQRHLDEITEEFLEYQREFEAYGEVLKSTLARLMAPESLSKEEAEICSKEIEETMKKMEELYNSKEGSVNPLGVAELENKKRKLEEEAQEIEEKAREMIKEHLNIEGDAEHIREALKELEIARSARVQTEGEETSSHQSHARMYYECILAVIEFLDRRVQEENGFDYLEIFPFLDGPECQEFEKEAKESVEKFFVQLISPDSLTLKGGFLKREKDDKTCC